MDGDAVRNPPLVEVVTPAFKLVVKLVVVALAFPPPELDSVDCCERILVKFKPIKLAKRLAVPLLLFFTFFCLLVVEVFS